MLLQLKDIVKKYKMGDNLLLAVNHVSLEIEAGEFVAIMGPSGSGKSTLMNMIGCLDRPDQGVYFLENKNVNGFSNRQLASLRNKTIGFVFQTFNLLPRQSALENVELPMFYTNITARDRKARAVEVLEMVGLGDRLAHKPNELSGGERQRVAIARALVNDPAIIMADEPTGNLDTKSGNEIMKEIIKLNERGKTIIMVTHEPDIAAYARRIIHLRDGIIEKDEINTDTKMTLEVGVGQ